MGCHVRWYVDLAMASSVREESGHTGVALNQHMQWCGRDTSKRLLFVSGGVSAEAQSKICVFSTSCKAFTSSLTVVCFCLLL